VRLPLFSHASRITSFSNIDSAGNFFRHAFSASSARSRSVPDLHAAELVAPEIVARLRKSMLAAQLFDRHAGIHLAQKTMICSSEGREDVAKAAQS